MTATTRYDAIIVGGGHNGLVCAAYLAGAGRKVLLLERRHLLGGAAVTEEHLAGFKYSACSYVVSLLRPEIIHDLELAKHGLSIIPLACSFTPDLSGPGLVRWPDFARTHDEISRLSRRDADRYPEFGKAMGKMGDFIRPLLMQPAPDPTRLPRRLGESLSLLRRLRKLGPRGLAQFVQLMTQSAVDLLDRWFESDRLKAPMACSGIIGTFLGVRSPTTAYVLLHHYMGEIDGAYRAWGFARGGTGAISEAIASAARARGAEILCEAAVEKITTRRGSARGVVLEDGREFEARVVISACDPRRTFFSFVGRDQLDDDFVAQITRYRYRGSSGKVNLALDRLPDFSCRPGRGLHLQGDIAIAPSIDYLERAYDEAKHGAFSRRPYINLVIPSLTDPTVAPPGKHVMSAFVQYAPYQLAEGPAAWDQQREAFGDTVVETLEEYCPGLKDAILHRQVLTPLDLEREYGLTEGNIFHGELSLEQLLFMRPTMGWARYQTPIQNLWLCASGAHPGGGLMGAPGALCARRLLEEHYL
ncbi:MAG: NAD(P)/FAD-dependent oxidoreductase [Deltaproteobacteria bacterium]|nr:NAD(P)/FAD-dependent oxidoreductase [Deltaproteobacteria bacterium]